MTKRKPEPEVIREGEPVSSRFCVEDMFDTEISTTEQGEQSHFRGKKFKNSLDSDEEDDEVAATKYNMLNPDDLEGQEDGTIEHDGEIKITPFNMNEELEEGHFDKEGTFIFHKDPNEIRDSWLDNIDWVKVKEQKMKDITQEESDSDDEEIDFTQMYSPMLEIMQPKETVQKALQRLGGKNTTASSRWKKKNQIEPTEEEIQNKEKLLQLTSLADKCVSFGNMEIYQQTFERLTFLVTAKTNPPPKFESTSEPADMFGDNFDADKVAEGDAQRVTELEKETTETESGKENTVTESAGEFQVTWEFKWENNDQAEIFGPHPTSEILRWIEEGYFKDGVWVRKVGEPNAPFYSSNRVDFELYT